MFSSKESKLLKYAAKNDTAKLIEITKKSGLDANHIGPDGLSALHHAAANSNADMTAALLRVKGITVDVLSDSQRTPLHVACGMGAIPVMELLLDAGADPKLQDMSGNSAFDIAKQLSSEAAAAVAPYYFEHLRPVQEMYSKKQYTELIAEVKKNLRTTDQQLFYLCLGLLTKMCYAKPLDMTKEQVASLDAKLVLDLLAVLDDEGGITADDSLKTSSILRAIYGINRVTGATPDNAVIAALAQRPDLAATTGELLVSKLNRTKSSTKLAPIVQLLKDIFTDPRTRNFFYWNDLKVMIDIIIREIEGLDEKDKLKPYFISLLRNIIVMTDDYKKKLYKNDKIMELLQRVRKGRNTTRETIAAIDKLLEQAGSMLKVARPTTLMLDANDLAADRDEAANKEMEKRLALEQGELRTDHIYEHMMDRIQAAGKTKADAGGGGDSDNDWDDLHDQEWA